MPYLFIDLMLLPLASERWVTLSERRLKIAGVSMRKIYLVMFWRIGKERHISYKICNLCIQVFEWKCWTAQFLSSVLESNNKGKHKPGSAVTGGTKIIYIFMRINKDNIWTPSFCCLMLLLRIVASLFICLCLFLN